MAREVLDLLVHGVACMILCRVFFCQSRRLERKPFKEGLRALDSFIDPMLHALCDLNILWCMLHNEITFALIKMCQILAHFNEPIPGVVIKQGMLGKNGAVRSITTGNEVVPNRMWPDVMYL